LKAATPSPTPDDLLFTSFCTYEIANTSGTRHVSVLQCDSGASVSESPTKVRGPLKSRSFKHGLENTVTSTQVAFSYFSWFGVEWTSS